jgi:adenylosuccinate lyase
MPHKRNPITAERVCGLARVVRRTRRWLDNVALWLERDISHSSAERVVLADTSSRSTISSQARVDPRRARGVPGADAGELESTRGLIYSSRVLLALVDAGMLREDAYAIVQRNAMAVWDDIQQAREGAGFRERLEADATCPLAAESGRHLRPRAFLARSGVLFERLEGCEF